MKTKKCWKCSAFYPVEDTVCPSCQAHPAFAVMRKAVGYVLVFSVAVSGAYFIGSNFIGVKDPKTPKENRAIANALTAIRQNLKDPESADFGLARAYAADGTIYVCGTVNAKNSFGGYTGKRRYIYESVRGSLKIESGDESFSDDWLSNCQ